MKNQRYALNCYRLRLNVRYNDGISAGQFVHILIDETTYPLLRRPFSIYDAKAGYIDILFKVVGIGTDILSKKKVSARVGFLGPLGNRFTINRNAGSVIFVAGGIGIAPFYILAKEYIKAGIKPILLFGARTKEELFAIKDFRRLSGLKLDISTDDGSMGAKGFVTDLLKKYLQKLKQENIQVHACGPEPMLKRVVEIAKADNIPCEVSLEKRMGCALGACGACVTKVVSENGDFRYSRICVEGPVYEAKQVQL